MCMHIPCSLYPGLQQLLAVFSLQHWVSLTEGEEEENIYGSSANTSYNVTTILEMPVKKDLLSNDETYNIPFAPFSFRQQL